MSTILGIHDGHNATAAVVRDGEVVSAISEGRMTRKKHQPGYPSNAISEVLYQTGVSSTELDKIALSGEFMHDEEFYRSHDWYRKNYRDQIASDRKSEQQERYYLNQRQNERKRAIKDQLGVPDEKIEIVEHHTGHAASAYYGCPWDEDVLVLTLDGSGDGICATVNVGQDDGFERVSETDSAASLGKVYSRTTFLLGLRPWHDEHKVCGMAPYAEQKFIDQVRPIFDPLVRVNGLEFEPGTHLSTNFCYSYLRSNLENTRFDWICGAVQQWLEDRVVKWVRNCVEETGIRRVAVAGGVFMNVKVNQKVRAMDCVEEFWAHPSCGDGSLAIGVAEHVASDLGDGIESLGSIYLGPQYSRSDIEQELERTEGVSISEPASVSETVADLLADGHVVANYLGRLEWGARALGNRSLLADPRDRGAVRVLNDKIKNRDFWMPFSPSILDEDAERYIDGWSEGDESRYMIDAFGTTEEGARDLQAAMHYYDETIRPQVVQEEHNPSYYAILSEFKKRTGVGGVLNTSLNLHGKAIVRTPDNALRVLKESGLRYLRIGAFLVEDIE